MERKAVATRLGILLLNAVVGFATAVGFSYLLIPRPGILHSVSSWLVANGLETWLVPWNKVCFNYTCWLLGFSSGVVIRVVFKNWSDLAASGFAVGFLSFPVVSLLQYPMILEFSGTQSAITMAIWDLMFVPIVFLGTSLIPNLRALAQNRGRWQFSVRGLLLTMLGSSIVLAGLSFGGEILTPAILLMLLLALAWVVHK